MANKKPMTLTSVKVQSDLFNDFKVECVRRKFSFQKLADRAIFLYLTDDDFCIVARVEAFIAGWGLNEAIKRAEAYRKSGADAILIHSKE